MSTDAGRNANGRIPLRKLAVPLLGVALLSAFVVSTVWFRNTQAQTEEQPKGWGGKKAGFCQLWMGTVVMGDDIKPDHLDHKVDFHLPDWWEQKHVYLQITTKGVGNTKNYFYINDKLMGALRAHGDDSYGFDGFAIDCYKAELKKGNNTFTITARNENGTIYQNCDDFEVADPILIYPIQ